MTAGKSFHGLPAWAMYVLMFFSGVAGLGYEMVWTRTFSTGLGHEVVSMLSVVGAFFAGLALGSLVLDGPVSRSASPHRWYAALEWSIGIWAFAMAFAIPAANGFVGTLTGSYPSPWRHWLVAFSLPLVLLFPATFAMGGTLPAMDRLVERISPQKGGLPGLYSANTLGATAGVLATTCLLVPAFGYRESLLILSGISLLCGGLVWFSRPAVAPFARRFARSEPELNRLRHGTTLFLTGLLGIGYEVLAFRAMEQVLEDTVYTFASILSVYLVGTALGAGAYRRWLAEQEYKRLQARLLAFVSLACALGVLVLWRAQAIYLGTRDFFQAGWTGSIAAEMVVATFVFFPATLAMGALFSHLAQGSRHDRGGVGWALGINTVGAALAPVLFGVVLLPAAGLKNCLIWVIAAYLFLIPWEQLGVALFTPASLIVLISFGPGAESMIRIPEGTAVLERREGVMATVTVGGDASDQRTLSVNNFATGGTGSRFPDYRQMHIPMLLHPEPRRVLSLGLGAGMTFEAAGHHPGVQADGVELVPEILPLLHYFQHQSAEKRGKGNLHYYSADARRFVRAGREHYDVIVGDLFHPARDGAGSLYTLEHFEAVRRRLNENGIFCQWLPLYQLELETVRLITRTFLRVFPNGSLLLCHNSVDSPIIGLLGTIRPIQYDPGWFEKRVRDSQLADRLRAVNLTSDFTLFGNYLAGPEKLSTFAGHGPLNTDDRPLVVYRAPGFVYQTQPPSRNRLLDLLHTLGQPDPGEIFSGHADERTPLQKERLRDCWRARDTFLQAMCVEEPAERSALLKRSLHESRDFADAYMFLLTRIVPQLADGPASALLRELAEAHPARIESDTSTRP